MTAGLWHYLYWGANVIYSLEFSKRLIDAAESFFCNPAHNNDDATARAVLYLSLLSCEISLKAFLEKAGYSVTELRKRSHNLVGLLEDVCACKLSIIGIDKKPLTGARLLSQEVIPNIYNGTVGCLLRAEEQGASKYPSEIRYGDLVSHFAPEAMLKCAKVVNEWAGNNHGCIKRTPARLSGAITQKK